MLYATPHPFLLNEIYLKQKQLWIRYSLSVLYKYKLHHLWEACYWNLKEKGGGGRREEDDDDDNKSLKDAWT